MTIKVSPKAVAASSDVTTALGYTPLSPANNLNEVTAATARTNLGLTASGILSATSQVTAGSLVLPAKGIIRHILVKNTTANAITGGLKFGTTAGATDIVAALTVGANFIGHVFDAVLLKRFFSTSATQTIFFDTVTLWNSASVDIYIIYDLLP
jgi:hypothetical protein